MKINSAAFVMVFALLAIGAAAAADQAEPVQAGGAQASTNQPPPSAVIGFGSATGMGPGGLAGSSSGIGGGFGAPGSGSGSQTFGGGFIQQTPGHGPLSTSSADGAGGGAGGPL